MKLIVSHLEHDPKWNNLVVTMNNGDRWKRVGHCLRCGKCCERGVCQSYDRESLNGKIIAKCSSQWGKPWQCKQWPDNPYVKLLKSCGFSWEKI